MITSDVARGHNKYKKKEQKKKRSTKEIINSRK